MDNINNIWAMTCDSQQCGMCDQQSLRSAWAYTLSAQSLASRMDILFVLSYWPNSIWSL